MTTQTAPAPSTAIKPIDRMLAAFPGLRQRSNGWWYHLSPKFDCLELENGDIRIKSWTGRSVEAILAMGDPAHPIKKGQLYAKPGQVSATQSRDKLDLLTLADCMCIDWRFLMNEGYSEGYTYTYSSSGNTVRCIKVGGCFTPDGKEHSKHQVRLSLHGKLRFLFDQNTPGHPLPFGLHHIPQARDAGYLVIGEGSSDQATNAFHGIPFVGIPGTSHVKSLDVELVKDIPTIYIIEEPDQVVSLRNTGMGFYKSVRHHLRSQGYEGQIFSIRFLDVTGSKDPSDLHKAIFAAVKEEAEGPFVQEVHKRYLAAIEAAIAQAIPEGNTTRNRATVRDLAHLSFEEFYREVWAVPGSFLTPIQKGIVCYLFLYMRDTEPDELGWHFDASKMAADMGFIGTKGVKTLQEHISYLHQKLGIIDKTHRARKLYINGDEGPEQVRYKGTDLYIVPTTSFLLPRGYCVVTADQHQHGGARVPEEVCELCGSKHLKHYARQCVDCGHVMYPLPEEDEMLPMEKVIRMAQVPELAARIQHETPATAVIVEAIPEHPKKGTSGPPLIDCNTAPQKGYLGNGGDVPLLPRSSPSPLALYDRDGLPTRLTICCNVPFQMSANGWGECSNPACPEKRERRAS